MKASYYFLVAFSTMNFIAGCQCCSLSSKYDGFIDHLVDNRPNFDGLYHAGLDVTRIGKPDWCRSPINRLACHRRCRKSLAHQPQTSACSCQSPDSIPPQEYQPK